MPRFLDIPALPMIRRDATDANGQPAWILVSQVEHARLAARIAEAWGNAPFEPLVPRGEVLAGIEHHDDGWAAWERRPTVDPQTGRPLDFTEVPIEVWLPIWQGSIDAAAQQGPLPGCMVAGHFTALLLRFSSRWSEIPAHRQLALSFQARQENAISTWLRQWCVMHGATAAEAQATAARSLAELQWFDLLSLWLCCSQRTESVTFDTPSAKLSLTPQPGGRVLLAPWPLAVSELEISTPGRQVAAKHYASTDELAAADSSDVTLRWTLLPQATN
ncbi:MAG: DUF3891 family protein [Pirellulales bacterium]|nr:DUF3891 family protein [Pirellulales bacterium]